MGAKRKYKVKIFFILLLLAPAGFINAQKIGEFAPEKPPEIFPPNIWGMDLMFGEGGFGVGTFYRRSFSLTTTGFVDISVSEAKDQREVDYVDIYGKTYSPNEVNRSFQVPVNFGIQYRIFAESITDNFRPYIVMGVGPTFIITDPANHEFMFAYRIVIENHNFFAIKLLRRKWDIFDSNGQRREVERSDNGRTLERLSGARLEANLGLSPADRLYFVNNFDGLFTS